MRACDIIHRILFFIMQHLSFRHRCNPNVFSANRKTFHLHDRTARHFNGSSTLRYLISHAFIYFSIHFVIAYYCVIVLIINFSLINSSIPLFRRPLLPITQTRIYTNHTNTPFQSTLKFICLKCENKKILLHTTTYTTTTTK